MKKVLLTALAALCLSSSFKTIAAEADVHDVYIKANIADISTSNDGKSIVIFKRDGFELEYTLNSCLSGGQYATVVVYEQNQLSRILQSKQDNEKVYLLAKVNCNASSPQMWLNKVIKDQEVGDAMMAFENNPPVPLINY